MDLLTTPAPWYLAGPAIGVLIVGLLWLTNKPLGALGAYIEITESALRRQVEVGWRTCFIAGVVVGGFVSAIAGEGWHPTFGYGGFDAMFGAALPLKAALLVGAGLLMGAGGRIAGGCTSGHGLCGTAFGSTASFVSTATFVATAIATMSALVWILGA